MIDQWLGPIQDLFRPPQRAAVRLGLALGIAALLGAACGGGTRSAPPSGTDPGQTPLSSFGAGGKATGVIEEFGMTVAQLVTSIETVESNIASCMRAAGFEYVPIDPVTFRAAQDALGSVPGVTSDEFVAQYGYGITTLPPAQDFGVGEANKRIFDGLALADQVAYQRTLLGEDTKATFMVTLEAEDFSPTGGCTGTAVEQVFTPEQLSPTYLNPLDARVQQDPRMVAARERWSACMHDGGYDFANQAAVEDELAQRLVAITEGADPSTLTGSAKDALTALQGEERAIALADGDCARRFVDAVEAEVQRDITGQ